MIHPTIDSDTTTVLPQHDLLERLAQLEALAQRGDFDEDHVIHVLLERYEHMRSHVQITQPRSA